MRWLKTILKFVTSAGTIAFKTLRQAFSGRWDLQRATWELWSGIGAVGSHYFRSAPTVEGITE